MGSLAPKQHKTAAEKFAILDKIAEKVNAKAGKQIIGRIGKNPEIMEKLTIKFIPTPSLDLNDALGGGFPRARMTIVSGLSDSGKSFAA